MMDKKQESKSASKRRKKSKRKSKHDEEQQLPYDQSKIVATEMSLVSGQVIDGAIVGLNNVSTN